MKDLLDIKIGIIGTGNVAFHLAKVFSDNDFIRLTIYGRNKPALKEFRDFNIAVKSNFSKAGIENDLVIMAVSDDAIKSVAEQLVNNEAVICHTSGKEPLHGLKGTSKNFGIFYPLQTFTKSKSVNFSAIPILIEGSNAHTVEILRNVANSLSKKVVEISSEEKRKLHVAAVVVNNFTNHLYEKAFEYCEQMQLDFNLLKPLIEETASKVLLTKAKGNQTGPAKRKDNKTIQEHIELIEDENLKNLYKLFTESIQKMYE